jgi:hypothetical protein
VQQRENHQQAKSVGPDLDSNQNKTPPDSCSQLQGLILSTDQLGCCWAVHDWPARKEVRLQETEAVQIRKESK